ncbi:hypothetical protein [Yersinia hibernica]|uniref:hypothetical protein n=1 Tax=Yersinia hibernica TaxID=2339259 RepID=UPI001FEB30C2|nr:hypothetical protein [Yersinia hibernica]
MNKLTEQQLQKIANPGACDIGGAQSPIVTQMAAELLDLRAELAAIKGEQKPLLRHVFSMLVNELRDVPAIGCKRELIIGVLNRHGVTAKQVK